LILFSLKYLLNTLLTTMLIKVSSDQSLKGVNMCYLITGGCGFIGQQLIRQLSKHQQAIYVLVRSQNAHRQLDQLRDELNLNSAQLIAIEGDITLSNLGVSADLQRSLKGKVQHLFHLAANYDLNADPELIEQINIEGTRNTLAFAQSIQVRCFHHVSSIAVAGMFRGRFREDMFTQHGPLTHAYLKTKYESERLVRECATLAWRIYRPGIVIGDSVTGECARIDGPYYAFKLIQSLRNALPKWTPLPGIEGGRLNLVPVDFVAASLAHIALKDGLDGRCFHLVDPEPNRAGEVINIFAEAAHSPTMAMRFDMKLFNSLPTSFWQQLSHLPIIDQLIQTLSDQFDIPAQALGYFNSPTQFDCSETLNALQGSGIHCPRLADYAPAIWDYWERNLDPDLHLGANLSNHLEGKVVLLTGASSGIGLATAQRLAPTGARLLLVARDIEKLEQARAQIESAGGRASIYSCNLSDEQAIASLIERVKQEHGNVDVLINNAGRSIRRKVIDAEDRLHDFQRTMNLNYFGALQLILGFLPGMRERKSGHIINISSISVLANTPRFSAYAASKAALDKFCSCAGGELLENKINFTTIYMPLVNTPMIAEEYQKSLIPLLSPEEASEMVAKAIVNKPRRMATRLGLFGAMVHGLSPKLGEVINSIGFGMSNPASSSHGDAPSQSSADVIALSSFMREIHM
jgi:NAD(P)-dependent dehydrogenase (short-subunit alcohol dehydrogenase family)